MDERNNGPGEGRCLMTFAITITIIHGVNSIHKATAQTNDTVSTKPDTNSFMKGTGMAAFAFSQSSLTAVNRQANIYI